MKNQIFAKNTEKVTVGEKTASEVAHVVMDPEKIIKYHNMVSMKFRKIMGMRALQAHGTRRSPDWYF